MVAGDKGARAGATRSSVIPSVFLTLEGTDLLLPLHYDAGGHALYAACGQAAAHFAPQQRGELITHNAVKNAAGLLGIHQILIEGAGVLDGFADHLLGDLIKGDAVGLVVRNSQQLLQVPGNGLSFAVRVGCEKDAFAVGGIFQSGNDLFLSLDGLVVGDKTGVDIDAQLGAKSRGCDPWKR